MTVFDAQKHIPTRTSCPSNTFNNRHERPSSFSCQCGLNLWVDHVVYCGCFDNSYETIVAIHNSFLVSGRFEVNCALKIVSVKFRHRTSEKLLRSQGEMN